MAKESFYPKSVSKRVELMEFFAAHIGDFPGKFTSLASDISVQATDEVVARRLYNYQQGALAHAQAATQFLARGFTGPATALAPLALPAMILPVSPSPLGGIEPRFLALVASMRKHKDWTPAIGEALHLIGPDKAPTDLAAAQPVFTAKKIGPNRIRLAWHKGDFDAIRFFVDRGDGHGRVQLGVDMVPDFDDTSPWPATAATWTYTAVYLLDDAEVGQVSAPVVVAM